MRETRVRSLGREDPLEKEMATHSSILAWRIPWREEPGRLQSMGSQRVRHDWATSLSRTFFQKVRRHSSKRVGKLWNGHFTEWEREFTKNKDCCCSVAQLCLILCNPMDCSAPGFPALHNLPEFAQIHVHWVTDPSNHLILCHPLLLLLPAFPSIRAFSSESALRIRWPKYFELQLQHQSFQWIFRVDFL